MNKWKRKRVLVTGAGGFIGSHLAEALTQRGAKVRALTHYRGNGSWGWLDQSAFKREMEVLPGDVRDPECVRRAAKNIDVIFHLAALIGIPYSYHAPYSYVSTNIGGTLNVLEAARLHEVERVVHTSTSEVYGTARHIPIGENHPLQGQSPYSASKIGGDKLAESFHLSFHTPVVTVRPFNTFGPRQSARAIIPTIISQLLKSHEVYVGNVYPLRDFNFVSNTVEGFIAAAESTQAIGKTINLGTGREIRIKDLILLIADLLGKEVKWVAQKNRSRPKTSEVDRLLADNALAKRLLHWSPRINLTDGLKMTVAWMRDNAQYFRSADYVI